VCSDTQDPEAMQTFTSAVSDVLLHHTVLFSVLVLFAEALSSAVLMLRAERGFDSSVLDTASCWATACWEGRCGHDLCAMRSMRTYCSYEKVHLINEGIQCVDDASLLLLALVGVPTAARVHPPTGGHPLIRRLQCQW
jgi:hypothetical protein